jgi:hypothetical protein
MTPAPSVPPEAWLRPLYPEARDQGDPYVLDLTAGRGPVPRSPGGAAAGRFRYYAYVTGEDAASGAAFPCYGSPDLRHWEALGWSLQGAPGRAHWAPCVRYLPGAAAPYVMLYSRAAGVGEAAHIGHAIRRAESERPEGPFRDSGHVLTPDLDFAIDPDVYRLTDGRLMLAFATDFVADAPLGTGIVEAPLGDDLARLLGPPRVLARAHYAWQVYDAARKMPWKDIPGVDWTRDTVRWHTVEAPAGGLVSPAGREVYLYSGGCFFGYYAIGAVQREASGEMKDLTEADDGFVVRPREGFFAPGHCCWCHGPDGLIYLVFHARFGSPDALRQMILAPLRWDGAGRPYAASPP